VPTEADHVRGIRSPGSYDAVIASEEEARQIMRIALPDAIELPPAVPGRPYPGPPPGAKRWFQLHPPDAPPGSSLPPLPHFKYVDWTRGKRQRGGSWGHLSFPPAAGG
jgi:hypothetical protein